VFADPLYTHKDSDSNEAFRWWKCSGRQIPVIMTSD
jgi:hypothetical protein